MTSPISITPAKPMARPCPQCGKPAVQRFRPFCSKRCSDLDLGSWLNEGYVLPGSVPAEGLDPD